MKGTLIMQANSDRNENEQNTLPVTSTTLDVAPEAAADFALDGEAISAERMSLGDVPSELLAEWWQIMDNTVPLDLLCQLIGLAANHQKEIGDCEPDDREEIVREAIYNDGEQFAAAWMSRDGFDIRESELTDIFREWSFEVVNQAIDLATPPSNLSRHVLGIAFRAFPKPLRDFLDSLTNLHELGHFDAVVQQCEQRRLCGDGEEGQLPDEVMKRSCRFLSNIRTCIDAAKSLSDALSAARDEIGLP